MPEMYCPRCGRELDLDSGEIRFCRYCGFSLVDTKEALHGYSEQKRLGFSIVTCAYALLLIVTLLLQGQYVSLNTGWVYWLLTLLIVVSVSFFASAAISALKPAMFLKVMRRDKVTLEPAADGANVLKNDEGRVLSPGNMPLTNFSNQGQTRDPVREPRSVVEGTTHRLNDREK
jgi:hypothetical protein